MTKRCHEIIRRNPQKTREQCKQTKQKRGTHTKMKDRIFTKTLECHLKKNKHTHTETSGQFGNILSTVPLSPMKEVYL